jgi:DMSO/TMAO reductase YedYZ heme-binding membrane subunit
VPDYVALVTDLALAAVAFAGTYYAFESSRLFRGDFMERVWRLVTTAFIIIAFFSILDFIFTIENSSLAQLDVVRIAAVFAICVFVYAMMTVVKWGKSSMESRTQLSRQYPQR